MLFRVIKRLIETGSTNGLTEKVDVFFAAGKLTEREYSELTTMLTVMAGNDV